MYDYVLVTEPLDPRLIGWQNRQGLSDMGNQFHYSRLTADGRILWGGAIDTCSRFSAFFGRTHGGRVAYALGYTGLGVGASRFAGRVALDLLDGRSSEASALSMVRRRPLPFPPEPLRTAVIQLTRNRLAAADRHEGRRGRWLTALDRLGLGFDS